MTIGCSEWVTRLTEIVAAEVAAGGSAEAIAERVTTAFREEFGGVRLYVAAVPDGKRDKALLMLKSGASVDRVAAAVGVHVSTVYRWSAQPARKPRGSGFGRDDWVL